MKRKILFVLFSATLLFINGCQEKAELPKEVQQAEEKQEKAGKEVPTGQFDSSQVKEWIEKIAGRASIEDKKKAEANSGKFTSSELLAGVAVRPMPDYWHDVAADKRSQTIAIMNTNFSKARISAGLEEDVETLNSTIYIEDDKGQIIASSSPGKGSELFENR